MALISRALKKLHITEIFFIVALAANICLGYVLFTIPRHTIVTALDVGQGDAILIQTPQLQNILIDGGPDSSVLAGLGRHLPFYNQQIDLIMLTHAHADHMAGLLDVLNRFSVKQIMMSTISADSELFKKFVESVDSKKIPIVRPHIGQSIRTASTSTQLFILYPFTSFNTTRLDNINNASIVAFLDDAQDVLFMGDAEAEVEEKLVKHHLAFHANILKAGHHGSKTSTSQEFLEQVGPAHAIISAGEKNKYKHPAKEILDRLIAAGIAVRRTDEQGDVSFTLVPD